MVEFTKEELEEALKIAASIIYSLADNKCPIKCIGIAEKNVSPCIAGDICRSVCPKDESECWYEYLLNEVYFNRIIEEDEDGDTE